MIEKLINEIKKAGSFPEEEIELFFSYMTESFIAKGDHFLKMGEISHSVAYITSGLAMHYKMHDGIEIPIAFSVQGEWLANLKSFSDKAPADIAIKALEDTRVLKLTATKMEELFHWRPAFMALKNVYTEQSLMNIAQHGADLAMLSGKERYYKFRIENPDLLNRVPQYYVAAYLGIKPQSLSRLRNEK